MATKDKGNSVWTHSHGAYSLASGVEARLPPGCYVADSTMDGRNILIKQDVNTDDLVVVADSVSEKILKEIETFWGLKDKFEKHGFVHKRGILLAGPPGGGKTVTLNLIIQAVINDFDGIAVYMSSPKKAARCLADVRAVEKTRPVVCIIEDIDELINMYGEVDLLDLLDGGAQIDNIVFLATTNHVEKLEDRIVRRPSRFDTVEFVLPPSADIRRKFLEKKDPSLTPEELDRWVELSEGLSFAHLKEMIIMNRCFGKDIDGVVDRLTNLDVRQQSNEFVSSRKNPMGFKWNSEDKPDLKPPTESAPHRGGRRKIDLKKDFGNDE